MKIRKAHIDFAQDGKTRIEVKIGNLDGEESRLYLYAFGFVSTESDEKRIGKFKKILSISYSSKDEFRKAIEANEFEALETEEALSKIKELAALNLIEILR